MHPGSDRMSEEEFGQRLRRARTVAGLSRAQVATALAVRRADVARIEHGRRRLSTFELHELARLYRKPSARCLIEPAGAPPIRYFRSDYRLDERDLIVIEEVGDWLDYYAWLELSALGAQRYEFPTYPLPPGHAAEQGDCLAAEERSRLRLLPVLRGARPVRDPEPGPLARRAAVRRRARLRPPARRPGGRQRRGVRALPRPRAGRGARQRLRGRVPAAARRDRRPAQGPRRPGRGRRRAGAPAQLRLRRRLQHGRGPARRPRLDRPPSPRPPPAAGSHRPPPTPTRRRRRRRRGPGGWRAWRHRIGAGPVPLGGRRGVALRADLHRQAGGPARPSRGRCDPAPRPVPLRASEAPPCTSRRARSALTPRCSSTSAPSGAWGCWSAACRRPGTWWSTSATSSRTSTRAAWWTG